MPKSSPRTSGPPLAHNIQRTIAMLAVVLLVCAVAPERATGQPPPDTAMAEAPSGGIRQWLSYRKLYGLFVRQSNSQGGVLKHHRPTERFEPYANREIAEIRFVRLKAFGPSTDADDVEPERWSERLGNALHTTTQQMVLAHNVLFGVGQPLNPIAMVETEVQLRSLSYIEDVRIVVVPIELSNMVRVVVICKDRFTLGADVRFDDMERWQVGLSETNLGGVGLRLMADLYHRASQPEPYGYKLEMAMSNIGGSFIDARAYHRRGVGYRTSYFGMLRPFFASQRQLAGGYTFMDTEEDYGVFILDTTVRTAYRLHDCWLAYAFRLSSGGALRSPYMLSLAVKLRDIRHRQGLPATDALNPHFSSVRHYLAALGITHQNLHQTNLIHQFGATEDVPSGFRLQLATGFEEDKYRRRYLVNGELAGASYMRVGYLYGSARVGGYITARNQLEQASFNLTGRYISPLLSAARHELRQFVSLSYTQGIRRLVGEREYIMLGNGRGLRGLTHHQLVGDRRLYANLELMAYSPFKFYGFRLAYFGFYDVGLVGFGEVKPPGALYSAVGLGLRVRNESTVFPTLMLRLAYYPHVPDGVPQHLGRYLSTESAQGFDRFYMSEPVLLPFE
ncbi:MAG: hypothetical protein IJU72_01755 [Bacteroidales bacterium]|nr:hypothetical protein [Bacteroidales bacterium]